VDAVNQEWGKRMGKEFQKKTKIQSRKPKNKIEWKSDNAEEKLEKKTSQN
jgi:hypothetical protein